MIGLQELIIKQNIKVKELANRIEVNPSCIYDWFKNNRVPKPRLKVLAEMFNVNEEYLNEQVNDINTYIPKKERSNNNYIVKGDIAEIYIIYKKNKIFITIIDVEDLEKVINFPFKWVLNYKRNIQGFYAQANVHIENPDGGYKNTSIALHRFLTNAQKGDFVDHINHNTLDNRKSNLRKVSCKNNSTNRKGANKNNNTGVRNVSYIEDENSYWVQFMKQGERFRWVFPAEQFREACEFAEKKRKELFGEFAGNS